MIDRCVRRAIITIQWELTIFLQFGLLASKILKRPELSSDPRFSTNVARVANRAELVQIVTDALMQHERDHWLKEFEGLG